MFVQWKGLHTQKEVTIRGKGVYTKRRQWLPYGRLPYMSRSPYGRNTLAFHMTFGPVWQQRGSQTYRVERHPYRAGSIDICTRSFLLQESPYGRGECEELSLYIVRHMNSFGLYMEKQPRSYRVRNHCWQLYRRSASHAEGRIDNRYKSNVGSLYEIESQRRGNLIIILTWNLYSLASSILLLAC